MYCIQKRLQSYYKNLTYASVQAFFSLFLINKCPKICTNEKNIVILQPL